MAKQVEDVVTDDRVESLKTVKFGGYDKASVDYYIDELKEKHNKEVEELKANVNKLSEAVLSLKTMRDSQEDQFRAGERDRVTQGADQCIQAERA